MDGGSYSLVIAFDTDDAEFCRGWEAGETFLNAQRFAKGEQVHELDGPDALIETMHATNAEMILRIAECHGLAVRTEEVGDGWLHATFTRIEGTEAQD